MRTNWNFRVCGLLVLVLLCLVVRPGEAQWREVALPSAGGCTPKHMAWADSLRGFVFTFDGGFYWRTIDGGETWQPDTLPTTADSLLQREQFWCGGVQFADREFGVVSFSRNGIHDSVIFCTTDGGANWTFETIRKNKLRHYTIDINPGTRAGVGRILYNLYNRQYDDGVVGKELLRSTDCGATWHVFATDSLSMDLLGGEYGFEWYYVTLDSLTHY